MAGELKLEATLVRDAIAADAPPPAIAGERHPAPG